jgi:exodeoxyribonuclease-3
LGYVDGLRVLTDAPDLYTWWSYRANARTNNKGWRIDYFLLSESLAPSLKAHPIHTDVHTSDHCPLEIVLG